MVFFYHSLWAELDRRQCTYSEAISCGRQYQRLLRRTFPTEKELVGLKPTTSETVVEYFIHLLSYGYVLMYYYPCPYT